MIVLNLNRLKRNYFKEPLRNGEDLCKEDLLYLYIEKNLSSEEICNMFCYPYYRFKDLPRRYNIYKPKSLTEELRKSVCLERYGVDNISKTEEFKRLQKVNKELWTSRQKKKCLERYGVECLFSDSNYMRKSYQKKLGVDNPAKLESVKEKRKETQRNSFSGKLFFQTENCRNLCNNDTSNKKRYLKIKGKTNIGVSKEEEEIYRILLTKYPDTLHTHMDSRYPFKCDFYIPSLDLFIEYQGNWTHGFRPFVGSKEQLERLQVLQEKAKERNAGNYYYNAIYTWTNLDIRKRETVKNNKLNFLEFFNVKQFMEWFNNI